MTNQHFRIKIFNVVYNLTTNKTRALAHVIILFLTKYRDLDIQGIYPNNYFNCFAYCILVYVNVIIIMLVNSQ